MSEYQYYEFCRLFTPLDQETRQVMQALSSRTRCGTHGASYVYHYGGGFKGKPEILLLKYFDVFFYMSSWGTIKLLFKYARIDVNFTELKRYQLKDVIDCSQHDQFIILSTEFRHENGLGWTEGEGVLPMLLPLYDEIKNKNYQFLQCVIAMKAIFVEGEAQLKILLANNTLSLAQQAYLHVAQVG